MEKTKIQLGPLHSVKVLFRGLCPAVGVDGQFKQVAVFGAADTIQGRLGPAFLMMGSRLSLCPQIKMVLPLLMVISCWIPG